MTRTPVPLDRFGDVLTDRDICAVLGKGPRYLDHLITLQHKTGEQCVPDEIPGIKRRYTKDAVKRWLKKGVPELACAQKTESRRDRVRKEATAA